MTQIYQVAMPFTILFESAKPVLEINGDVSQMLFGESFEIKEQDGPFVRGVSKEDKAEGWMHSDALTDQNWLPTHFVSTLWAPVFPHAGHKNWAMLNFPFLSRIEVDAEKEKGDYAFIPVLRGYIHKNHIEPLAALKGNKELVAEIAQRFIEAPYQLGGRTIAGIDGTGLIQMAVTRAGYDCPRGATEQQMKLGTKIEFNNVEAGDIFYTKDHAGIMLDKDSAIWANPNTMSVEITSITDIAVDPTLAIFKSLEK